MNKFPSGIKAYHPVTLYCFYEHEKRRQCLWIPHPGPKDPGKNPDSKFGVHKLSRIFRFSCRRQEDETLGEQRQAKNHLDSKGNSSGQNCWRFLQTG